MERFSTLQQQVQKS